MAHTPPRAGWIVPAVSAVLHAVGAWKGGPLTSGAMGQALKPGPGAVSVYYNAGHTFMKIGNRYWGTSVNDGGAGGLTWHPAPDASYLAQYNVGHVPGLGKKQAYQLGVALQSGGTAVSGGGSSSGGGAVGPSIMPTPGFSDRPIQSSSKQDLLYLIQNRNQPGIFQQFAAGDLGQQGGLGQGIFSQFNQPAMDSSTDLSPASAFASLSGVRRRRRTSAALG